MNNRLPADIERIIFESLSLEKLTSLSLTSQKITNFLNQINIWNIFKPKYGIPNFPKASQPVQFINAARVIILEKREHYLFAEKIFLKYPYHSASLYFLALLYLEKNATPENITKGINLLENLHKLNPVKSTENLDFEAEIKCKAATYAMIARGYLNGFNVLENRDIHKAVECLQKMMQTLDMNYSHEDLIGLPSLTLQALASAYGTKILIKFSLTEIEQLGDEVLEILGKKEGQNILDNFNADQIQILKQNLLLNTLATHYSEPLFKVFSADEILKLERILIHQLTSPQGMSIFDHFSNDKEEIKKQSGQGITKLISLK